MEVVVSEPRVAGEGVGARGELRREWLWQKWLSAGGETVGDRTH